MRSNDGSASVASTTLLLLCLLTSGCSVTATKPRPTVQPGSQEHLKIVGYSTVDGEHRRVEGKASFHSDSVYIRTLTHTTQSQPGVPRDTVTLALPAEQLRSVDVRRFSAIRTLGLAATPIVVWYVVFLFGGFQGTNE